METKSKDVLNGRGDSGIATRELLLLPNPANLPFVEELYENFLRDAASVPREWQQYFSDVANGELRFPKPHFGPSFRPFSIFNPPNVGSASGPRRFADAETAALQDRVYLLIRLYRVRGHR